MASTEQQPTPAQSWPEVLHSDGLRNKIASAKVLAVGAGGIGCELLKTLVMSGFRNVEVIDLDTIEVSNLNRQFLFRKHHVGQSKAAVAASVVASFAPDARITAHQANIKESRFDLDYIRGFDVVLNGLDNMEARRHVNRLCVATGVPLVESGTAGYMGQVTVHLKGKTECYECTGKNPPKTYPICTLRNTPSQPIHCIVWAKDMLFQRLFGRQDGVTGTWMRPLRSQRAGRMRRMAQQQVQQQQVQQQQQQQQQQSGAPAPEIGADGVPVPDAAEEASFFARQEGHQGLEEPLQYAMRIFNRVFTSDIQRLLGMTDLWKARPPPTPLVLSELLPDTSDLGTNSVTHSSASKALGLSDQQVWSTVDNARVFLKSICMFLKQRPDEVGSASFDKDDDLATDFVAAASNLRSACYGIAPQSQFAARGMAGNIIHAIATTNAIISGMIVIEAIKILGGLHSACRVTFVKEVAKETLTRRVRTTALVSTEAPPPPRRGCMVCGKAQLQLEVNTATMTLKDMLDKVFKKRLAVNQPTLLCGDFMYEEGEGLEEDEVEVFAALLPKPLAALPGGGIQHNSVLMLSDQSQDFSVQLLVAHKETFDEEKEPDGFVLRGQVPAAEAAGKAGPSGTVAAAQQAEPNGAKKRGREADNEGQAEGPAAAGAKRPKPMPDEAVAVDDDDCIIVE